MNKLFPRLALIVSLITSVGALAQTSQGILTGVVRDSSGAVVPNAVVTIKGVSDGATRTVKTLADGAYRIESLSPEPYTLTATTPGFEGYKAEGVIVTPSQVTSYGQIEDWRRHGCRRCCCRHYLDQHG